MSGAQEITFQIEGDIALIGIDRPSKRNAMRQDMFEQVGEFVDQAQKVAKVGIIFGHGGHFSAGLDLGEHKERSPIDTLHASRAQGAIMNKMEQGNIPWIAALSGATIGAGLELAASTHIRIADETTFFALPEGRRGIYVGGGASVRVARLISAARMMDMMLTSRVMNAAEAVAANAVQYIVPEGNSLAKAREIAGLISENSSVSNYAIINTLARIQDMSHDDGLFVESIMAALVQSSPEAQSGLADFLEKRARRLDTPPSR
ncbi:MULTISPECIES: crotonase/enoyl-CoA hydratase family protein [unclassified Sphingobium]|nr:MULTISPECIES: crotonase/enoyl-CoA hydratase family protein [unclassified Sphingobium]MBG6116394.1 enoyl-CoA hydratase/carnithine racemase [Sphingobium sp. JAI105]PSO09638.1 enoyl-CoA hydratase [Sphingobium sp. AEW4]TWC97407.1 vanillin synthase /trans-feruloyl-CoA hydratase [Sphingobium sp. AEW010]TWD17781.1 vanillin synthase /trans-feruloyl-CoA hydratase [Sphingobium sp. AEW013]TWD20023.1 vanillin synthase /trans-feruloyl-CoA hydratase [Sphingobium sp. AEW001]